MSDLQPQSICAVSGETLLIDIAVEDSSGDAVDLTGATARFVMARTASSTPVASSTASPATATVEVQSPASNGVIRVTVDEDVTETLSGTYYWEAWIHDTSDNDVCVALGYATLRPNLG